MQEKVSDIQLLSSAPASGEARGDGIVILPTKGRAIGGAVFVGGLACITFLALLRPHSDAAALPIGFLFFLAFSFFALTLICGVVGLEKVTGLTLTRSGISAYFMFSPNEFRWEDIADFSANQDSEGEYSVVARSAKDGRLLSIYGNVYWNQPSDQSHALIVCEWLKRIAGADAEDRAKFMAATPSILRVKKR